MNVEIKEMRPEDWKIFQKLNQEVFDSDAKNDADLDLSWPQSETGINYYKKVCDGKYGAGYIAWYEKVAIGYVALRIKDFGYRFGKYAEIENIGVSPDYRSKGVGKQLLETATIWAKTQKATKVYVEAYSKNSRAISFYREFGFEDIGLQLEKKI